jgi:hypothetical protein
VRVCACVCVCVCGDDAVCDGVVWFQGMGVGARRSVGGEVTHNLQRCSKVERLPRSTNHPPDKESSCQRAGDIARVGRPLQGWLRREHQPKRNRRFECTCNLHAMPRTSITGMALWRKDTNEQYLNTSEATLGSGVKQTGAQGCSSSLTRSCTLKTVGTSNTRFGKRCRGKAPAFTTHLPPM